MAKKVKKLVRKFPPARKAKAVKKVAKAAVKAVPVVAKPRKAPILQVSPEGVVLSKNVTVSADGVVTVR